MPLFDSLGASAAQSFRLSKMNSVPTTEDLKYALAEATKRRKTVELPFEHPHNRQSFIVKVQLGQGVAPPIWTFCRGDGPQAKVAWTRATVEVMTIQSKVATECNRSDDAPAPVAHDMSYNPQTDSAAAQDMMPSLASLQAELAEAGSANNPFIMGGMVDDSRSLGSVPSGLPPLPEPGAEGAAMEAPPPPPTGFSAPPQAINFGQPQSLSALTDDGSAGGFGGGFGQPTGFGQQPSGFGQPQPGAGFAQQPAPAPPAPTPPQHAPIPAPVPEQSFVQSVEARDGYSMETAAGHDAAMIASAPVVTPVEAPPPAPVQAAPEADAAALWNLAPAQGNGQQEAGGYDAAAAMTPPPPPPPPAPPMPMASPAPPTPMAPPAPPTPMAPPAPPTPMAPPAPPMPMAPPAPPMPMAPPTPVPQMQAPAAPMPAPAPAPAMPAPPAPMPAPAPASAMPDPPAPMPAPAAAQAMQEEPATIGAVESTSAPHPAPEAEAKSNLPPKVTLDKAAVLEIRAALSDTKTGFMTSKAFVFFLMREWERFQLHTTPLSVIALEIGIKYPDQVVPLPVDALPALSQRLQSACTLLDVMVPTSPGSFAIVLAATDSAAAVKFCQRLITVLTETPLLPDAEGQDMAQIAIGAASIPETCMDPEVLVAAALKAKESARNSPLRYALFS